MFSNLLLPLKTLKRGLAATLKKIKNKLYILTRDKKHFMVDTDVIITTNEVNELHGTGIFVNKIFPEHKNIISIRSHNDYGGRHSFGEASILLANEPLTRARNFSNVIRALQGATVKRILCIPYHADDLVTAIVLRDLFEAPLCIYLMDDNNLFNQGISDDLMQEALTKSSLRLAISPELRTAYEDKYHLPFWVLPPLVETDLMQTEVRIPKDNLYQEKVGALVGNVWATSWLTMLRPVIKASGYTVHWFGSLLKWVQSQKSTLRSEGFMLQGYIPKNEDLVARLREYPYIVMPSGTLDARDDRPSIARLSLPSRLPFILATSHTPIIVLGSPDTAAARFVTYCQIGVVADYTPESFREAVNYITQPEVQLAMRQRAALLAPSFAVEGVADWIWQSLAQGQACDLRYEMLLPRDYPQREPL